MPPFARRADDMLVDGGSGAARLDVTQGARLPG